MNVLRNRFSLSLSTWFCIPEQGMKDLEILSRSSASVIRTKRLDKVRLFVVIATHLNMFCVHFHIMVDVCNIIQLRFNFVL